MGEAVVNTGVYDARDTPLSGEIGPPFFVVSPYAIRVYVDIVLTHSVSYTDKVFNT